MQMVLAEVEKTQNIHS